MPTDTHNQVTGLILQNQNLAHAESKRAVWCRDMSHSRIHSVEYRQWLRSRARMAQEAAARTYERIAFLRDL